MSRTSRTRILVVDDLEDAADSQALLLEMWGYDIQVRYDGPSALETACAYLPQVVLLDVAMPRMDGFQVAHLLRAQPELVSVVLIGISGYDRECDRIRGRAEVFNHYLVKPVGPDDLQELLGRVTLRAADVQTDDMPKLALDQTRDERESMETIIQSLGCYNLVRTEEGFAWRMTSQFGSRWYWHPKTRQWTGRCEASPTREDAAVGFDPSTPERAVETLKALWTSNPLPALSGSIASRSAEKMEMDLL